MQASLRVLKIISISAVLSACANKDTILPIPEHDMRTVYDMHMQGVGDGKLYDHRSVLRRPMAEGDMELSDYVRTEKTQLESKFKMVPNPIMFMFVAPHLASSSEVPIPGYVTQFRMWEKDNYAMPGEISDLSSKFGE
jgi:conjugative transfer region lipoprotein (TIGR03751 family)